MVQDAMAGINDKWVAAFIKQKDPKRHEAARKGHEKYMNRLDKSILSSQAPKYATTLVSSLPTM